MEDEVFGPILPILITEHSTKAMERISKGHVHWQLLFLAATKRRLIGSQVKLSFGGGAVNQVNVHLFVESMPFGGVGSAGIGHYYGKYGFRHVDPRQVHAHI